MLACDDASVGEAMLERQLTEEHRLLMISNVALGKAMFKKYDFADGLECFQVAYYSDDMPEVSDALDIRLAEEKDVPFLMENYDALSEEEMREEVKLGNILLGYEGNEIAGFVGEHLEGSIGLLHVLPKFRRKGYAIQLENAYIRKNMEAGFVPFGQVEIHNQASLALQEKLGLTRSEGTMIWMWR
ncbi:Ribosomal protein S18 acetylase RimI [Lachnospiraceae bacterium XBB1006]|nr:Ribosomal protein S18 acetylase RimI [Lachnospiraceae bacterium XBB1006]